MLVDAVGVFLPNDPDGNAKLVFSILDCLPKANRVSVNLVMIKLTKLRVCVIIMIMIIMIISIVITVIVKIRVIMIISCRIILIVVIIYNNILNQNCLVHLLDHLASVTSQATRLTSS